VTRVRPTRLVMKTALALSLALPAGVHADSPSHARWAVRVSSDGHSSFIDQPNCHPLDYFAHDLSHYDVKHPLDRKQLSFLQDAFSSRPIAEIAGYKVLQLEHMINDHELMVKMLVVQRTPGEFCEIYHQEWMDEDFYEKVLPARQLDIGSETILITDDPLSGNGNWFDEHYWAFDKEGPIDLCVSEKIREIQESILPKEFGVMNGGGFNLQDLTFDSRVWGPNDAHCCPSGGNIRIRFALKNHQLVVASQSYKKD
jgi:hypothetical protein